MCLSLAAYALIVVYDNIVDYGSNFTFVGHVMSMDTTFPNSDSAHAQSTSRSVAYRLLDHHPCRSRDLRVAADRLVAFVESAGGERCSIQQAKASAIMGATAGFLVWFTAIMIVGGEWFSMWQSATWNGQQPAARIYLAVIGVLIYVNQSDVDIAKA